MTRGLIRNPEKTRETIFLAMLKQAGLPHPHREYRFEMSRRWRFDYAFPQSRVAVEVEGGAWTRGRHTRGAGFLKDCEKYSEAAAQGWLVIRVAPQDLCTERTVDWIRRALGAREAA